MGIAIAPGRVNLLGEHLDYNGGLALPCAIDLRAYLAAAPGDDRTANLMASDLGERCQFNLDELETQQTLAGEPLPEWARYFAGVAWSLQQSGCRLTGIRALLHSEVPIGAGLSSSAAIEVAAARAWLALSDQALEPMALAKLCQRAENEYVGVDSGLLDQWTVTHGRQNHALLLDFSELSSRLVELPQSIALVIADSGVRRSLTASAYSQRVAECRQVLDALKLDNPSLNQLGQATMAQLDARRRQLSRTQFQRGRHVISEVRRVRQAVEQLKAGLAAEVGPLMLAGHASLRDDYEVSCPELDLLVELAAGIAGCHGARLTGAGFGGCTINWVEADKANSFCQQLTQQYQSRAGRQAATWVCRAVEAARWQPLPN